MKKQQTHTKPLVSVIMPAYNAGKFVVEAVQSILNQTYQNIELIVVDDGSKDDTWEKLKTLKASATRPMKIYRFKKNQSETAAANFAFSKSKGEYIARMDADDISYITRIQKQVDYMELHPRVALLGGQANVINSNGKNIGRKGVPTSANTIYSSFAYYQPMIHPSNMFRRSMLPKRDFLYNTMHELANDYHTYFELMNYGEFHNLSDTLVSYRVHVNNKSLSNIKKIFWQDAAIRVMAINKYNYRAPLMMFPVIGLQAIIVALLPENVLRELFYYLRGIKKIQLPSLHFLSNVIPYTIKRYAVSLR